MAERKSFLVTAVFPGVPSELNGPGDAVVLGEDGPRALRRALAADRREIVSAETIGRCFLVVAPDSDRAEEFVRGTVDRWRPGRALVADLGVPPEDILAPELAAEARGGLHGMTGGAWAVLPLDPLFIIPGEDEAAVSRLREHCRELFAARTTAKGKR